MREAVISTDSPTSEALKRLLDILSGMESAVIAYSGGVDSTLLLKAAALSGIKTMAVTGVSPTLPEQDLSDAKEMVKAIGIPHMVIETSELENTDFSKNPVNRCFYCKDGLFGKLKELAAKKGYRFVLDGSNSDDLNDWRPGKQAAEQHGVRSPLAEAGLGKEEIRSLSYELRLSTWDKPASPCLSSRFPYGEPITRKSLRQVETAEKFLKTLGFKELRVRHNKDTARIELKEEDIVKMLIPVIRKSVTDELKALGYKFICLDLEGFRSGKLNG